MDTAPTLVPPDAAPRQAAPAADPRCCPLLPPVLSVLVCGDGAERLPSWTEAQAHLPEIIHGLLVQAFDCARDAFKGSGFFYDCTGGPRLRVLTGSADDTDAVAAEVAGSIEGAETVVIAPSQAEAAQGGRGWCLYFECPGEDPSEAQAHGVAREARDQLALAHADLVLAVWDGAAAGQGRGGTVRLMHKAALARKPVVWIEPPAADSTGSAYAGKLGKDGPHKGCLHLLNRAALLDRHLAALHGPEAIASSLHACFRPFDTAEFRREVHLQLAPAAAGSRGAHAEVADLYKAHLPGPFLLNRAGALDTMLWHLAGLDLSRMAWNGARLVGGDAGRRLADRMKTAWTKLHAPPCPQNGGGHVEAGALSGPAGTPDLLFKWADTMANAMAGRHRGSVWIISIFGALAVLFAVWGAVLGHAPADAAGSHADHGAAHSPWAWVLPVFEMLVLVVVIALLVVARRRRWHRRWLFCRFIAEQLRIHDMLEPLLGTAPAAMRSPWRGTQDGLRFEDPGAWVVQRWLAGRSFGRGAGQQVVRLDPGTAAPLCRAIEEQVNWMHDKKRDLERQHRNMERLSQGLFVLAFLAVVAQLWMGHVDALLFATAFFPAAGAAAAAVVNQGEVQRVAHGYDRLAQRLRDLSDAVTDEAHRAHHEPPGSHARWLHLMQVRQLGLEAGRLMAEENQTWHDLLLSRVPALP